MKALIERFKEWFAQLADRERVLVVAGGAAVLVTVLFLAVWEPLVQAHRQRADALDAARATALRLEQAAALVQQSRKSGSGGAAAARNVSLLSAVDQATRSGALGKAPERIQPEGDKEVKLWLEDIAFDNLLRWLAELETRYGIIAQSAEIERESAEGLVNARLSLVRP